MGWNTAQRAPDRKVSSYVGTIHTPHLYNAAASTYIHNACDCFCIWRNACDGRAVSELNWQVRRDKALLPPPIPYSFFKNAACSFGVGYHSNSSFFKRETLKELRFPTDVIPSEDAILINKILLKIIDETDKKKVFSRTLTRGNGRRY
mgnify:CR=1 FL=1